MLNRSFPDGFLWGAATAAHQIEGGNVNNDWWQYEHSADTACVEPSGDACDSWHRWEEDLDAVAELGLGAYRFSVEWSRIEPAEGEFSAAALEHYRRMCAGCHERGLMPVVTFHHFTTPLWLAKRGAFEAPDAPERFAIMCERSVAALGDLVGMACTLNEPNMVSLMGYLAGYFPPKARDPERRRAVNGALCRAHRLAVEALRSGAGDFPVGLTVAMTDYQVVEGGEAGEAKRDRIRHSMEDVFLESTAGDDFIGVQTYTRSRIGPEGALGNEDGLALTQMGYEFYPEALEATIRRAHAVTGGLPVFVTENGISTDDDSERVEYVSRALAGVQRCLSDGIDVRGYFYWSLLDNFEWARGYGPRFGLVSVDRQSFARVVKPSGSWLASVARSNGAVVGR